MCFTSHCIKRFTAEVDMYSWLIFSRSTMSQYRPVKKHMHIMSCKKPSYQHRYLDQGRWPCSQTEQLWHHCRVDHTPRTSVPSPTQSRPHKQTHHLAGSQKCAVWKRIKRLKILKTSIHFMTMALSPKTSVMD